MIDMTKLFELINGYTVLLIPLVLGVTEVIKRAVPTVITDRIAPLISLVLAVAGSLLLNGMKVESAIVGVVIGLSSSGLWSGSKNVLQIGGKQ